MEVLTARLRLRPLCDDDADAYGLLLADPRIHPFVIEDGPLARDAAVERIARKRRAWAERTAVTWAMLRDDAFVGYVALHNLGFAKVAISYAVARDAQRQGLGGEAVAAVLGRGRELGFSEVEARTHVDNEASARLLRAVGFVETAPDESPPRRVFLWRA